MGDCVPQKGDFGDSASHWAFTETPARRDPHRPRSRPQWLRRCAVTNRRGCVSCTTEEHSRVQGSALGGGSVRAIAAIVAADTQRTAHELAPKFWRWNSCSGGLLDFPGGSEHHESVTLAHGSSLGYASLLTLLLVSSCSSRTCGEECTEPSGAVGGTASPPVAPPAGGGGGTGAGMDSGGTSAGGSQGGMGSSTTDPSTTSSSNNNSSMGSDDTSGSSSTTTTSSETNSSGNSSGGEVSREFLSQTGLYTDIASEELAPGVHPYAPQFELWTDGAEKRRWVYIPEGAQIDTSNTDDWKFPIGTKIWKEFSRDGVRIETRLIEKLPPERASEGFEGWLSVAYVWLDDQSDAKAAPDGLENAKGTPHDVPDQQTCGDCHDMRIEKPLGFSAVQLAHDGEGMTLTALAEQGLMSDPPSVPLTVPGTPEQRELLGYFHANCGHCHRDRAPTNNRVSSLKLWLESAHLSSFEETNAYVSLVNHPTESAHGSTNPYRIYGGDPDQSELMRRLLFRVEGGDSTQTQETTSMVLDEEDVPMPPVGTELAYEPAVTAIRQWIEALPPPAQEPMP